MVNKLWRVQNNRKKTIMSGLLAPTAAPVPQNDKTEKVSSVREYEIKINFKDALGKTSNERTSSSFPDDSDCYDKFKLRLSTLRGKRTGLQILHWNSQCIFPGEKHRFDISISQQCMTSDGLTAPINYTNTLELRCHRWVFVSHYPCEITDSVTMTVKIKIPIKANTLTFDTLQEEEEYRDFTLVSKNGAECKIHRIVLAAHSTAFRTMLKGNRNCSMRLNVDKDTLTEFVEYIYRGQQPQTNLTQLLKLAREFDMRDLANKCIAGLIETLTTYNALQMMNFATTNKCPSLIFAVAYFIKNNCDEIITENLTNMFHGKQEAEGYRENIKFDINFNKYTIGKMELDL